MRSTKSGLFIYLSFLAALSIFIQAQFLVVESRAGGVPGPRTGSLRSEYVPGEVIVRFKKRISPIGVRAAARALNSPEVKRLREGRSLLVKIAENVSVEDALAAYSSMTDIDLVQPNFIYYPALVPSENKFSLLWGLENGGQTVNFVTGTADADIDAPEAWDLETGSGSVIIAVIDTGVDYNHPDLANNIWTNTAEIPGNSIDDDGNGYIDDMMGWDFFDGDNDPLDPNGHGTHVAGTIGAEGNNGFGACGVMWHLKIMALKSGGSSGFFTTTTLESAIDYATDMGAQVINASWGGNSFDQVVRDAISRANDRGVLFVAAAGNSGRDIDTSPFYPASYNLPNIISVAATDQFDMLSSFSNFGSTSVDVAAPGANILSTQVKRAEIFRDDFKSRNLQGWTHGGAGDTWDTTENLSFSPRYSLTDSPGGNYADDTHSWVKNIIDLNGSSGTVLAGKVRGASELLVDTLSLQVSEDDAIWQSGQFFVRFDSSGQTFATLSGAMNDVWRDFTVDLGTVDGKSIFFRFLFDSNQSVNDEGWYLDDLSVSVSATPNGDDLAYRQGTSMAAPFVSGLAGLLLSSDPALTTEQVKSLIITGTDNIDSLSGKVLSGGRINAFTSLSLPPPDTSVQQSGGGGGGCTISHGHPKEPFSSSGLLIPYLVILLIGLRRNSPYVRI